MTQPVISPDGRFRWNGAKWVPVAVKLTPDLGAPRFMWKPSAGFKVFVAVFVLGLIAAGIAGAPPTRALTQSPNRDLAPAAAADASRCGSASQRAPATA